MELQASERKERRNKIDGIVGKFFLREDNMTRASIEAYVAISMATARELKIFRNMSRTEIAMFELAARARTEIRLFMAYKEKDQAQVRIPRECLDFLMELKGAIEAVGSFVYERYHHLPHADYLRENKEREVFYLDLLHTVTDFSVYCISLAKCDSVLILFEELQLAEKLIMSFYYALIGAEANERFIRAFLEEAPRVLRKFQSHFTKPPTFYRN